MTNKSIKKIAYNSGADLAGIASRERIESLPAESNPLHIMPHLNSIIVLAYQVLRGGLRGMETGSSWNVNGNPFSVMVEETYNFCRVLETNGWECVPLHTQSSDLRRQGVAVNPDKTEPDVIVDMYYIAYAAGLGSMGDGKFFLTPQYGPRQAFMAVLTDLILEPDPLFSGSVCDHCGKCIDACPAHAFDKNKWKAQSFPAGEPKWRPLHIESCRICKTGILKNPYDSGAEPNRLQAACGRACVAHLEDSARLERLFKNPFRTIK